MREESIFFLEGNQRAERKKREGKIRAGSYRACLWLGGQDREDSGVFLERGEKEPESESFPERTES